MKKTRKAEPPPKVWPFPTWKGQPYKMKRQKPAMPALPEAPY